MSTFRPNLHRAQRPPALLPSDSTQNLPSNSIALLTSSIKLLSLSLTVVKKKRKKKEREKRLVKPQQALRALIVEAWLIPR